jgi:hypothetical protein
MTLSNSVDSSLKDYINKNVLSRYKFSRVDLYLQPVSLLTVGGLKYNNTFTPTIETTNTLYNKFQTITDANDLDIRLIFNQPEEMPNAWAFNYYYNLFFEKL